MPPKSTPSVKQLQKKQDKMVEDKTFGLKNKNRSKTVQKYISSISQTVKGSNNPEIKRKLAEADARKRAKEEKERKEQEMARLFQDIKMQKEKKTEDNTQELPKVYNEETGEYMWQPEDFTAVEHDSRRLEEQLESELEQVRAMPLDTRTPVTAESFQEWKRLKKKEEGDKASRALKKDLKEYEKKGHGITGRNLWQHDAALFVDDENAASVVDYENEEEYLANESDMCAKMRQNVRENAHVGSFDSSLFDGSEVLPEE